MKFRNKLNGNIFEDDNAERVLQMVETYDFLEVVEEQKTVKEEKPKQNNNKK